MDDSSNKNLLGNTSPINYLEAPTDETRDMVGGGGETTGKSSPYDAKAAASARLLEQSIDDPAALTKFARGELQQETTSDLSPERKRELEEEIARTAEFFNGLGKPWYLAGGTGLELASGGLSRDHDDVDVAMFPDALPQLYDYATAAGYYFVRPLQLEELAQYQSKNGREPEITKKDDNGITWIKVQSGEELATGHNAFAKPTSENALLHHGFEVITLQKDNATGGTVFGADSDIVFPPDVYENPPQYTAANDQEVPLTPTVVQLMYKLYEGRQKDFEDIGRTLPTMDEAEKARLINLLHTANTEFSFSDGFSTKDINVVIDHATIDATRALADVDSVFDQKLDPIYSAAEQSSTSDELHQRLAQMFGEDAIVARADQLAKVAEFMYSDVKPTREQFRSFARTTAFREDYLRDKKQNFSSAQRWQVRKVTADAP